jgi:hypothetical protein
MTRQLWIGHVPIQKGITEAWTGAGQSFPIPNTCFSRDAKREGFFLHDATFEAGSR